MSASKIKSNPIKTVLTITLGMLVVFVITDMRWALLTALIVGILGLFSDFFAKKIDFLWMKLTWLLGLIVPNILLSVIFYLFLTPLAMISRLFGNSDQLMLKNKYNSIFKDTNKKFEKVTFEKPW